MKGIQRVHFSKCKSDIKKKFRTNHLLVYLFIPFLIIKIIRFLWVKGLDNSLSKSRFLFQKARNAKLDQFCGRTQIFYQPCYNS